MLFILLYWWYLLASDYHMQFSFIKTPYDNLCSSFEFKRLNVISVINWVYVLEIKGFRWYGSVLWAYDVL